MPQLTILPAGVTVEVAAGVPMLEAGESAGIDMAHGCRGCSCGTCPVEVVSGGEHLEPMTDDERAVIEGAGLDPAQLRLTCVVALTGGAVTIRQL